MPKITKRLVDAAEPRDKPYTIYDGQVPGFGIRVQPGGTKTFVVLYRFAHHRRCVSLGRHGVTTPEQARTSAINILARVRNGEDPAASRHGDGYLMTVADLVKRFDEEHIMVRLKPASAYSYRKSLRLHILPAIGKLRVTDVTRADVAKLHHDLRDTPYQSNRNLEIVSKMFNLAETWGVRPAHSNPRWGIKKYPEEKRNRYLIGNELARLGETLCECEKSGESQSTVNLIRLLLLTGCRLNEILTLKWEHVDLENGALHLPDSKTGEKTVHIGPATARILSVIERVEDNPWVIHRQVAFVPPGQPRQALAAHPGARRPRRRPHPRPAPHLRIHGGLKRRGPADDRQAAGPYSGTDHGSLCPSRGRSHQASGSGCFGQHRSRVG